MTTTTPRRKPLLRKGQRLTDALCRQIHAMAHGEGVEEVLLRVFDDWNTASSGLASTKGAKILGPYAPDLTFFCRRVSPESIGLYVAADRG